MNEIVGYLRYSDHKQDDGFSIEYQTSEIKQFAERNGLEIDRYFIDKAQTATKVSGREEFFALINAVKRNEIKTILVYKLSRMFRNTYESAKYRKLFREQGVKLMAVTQVVDEDTSVGRLTTNIMSSVDQYQSETISDHVKSSMREMARQGYYTGGTLRYGYTLESEKNGSKTRKKFVPHPTEAPIVKRIFEMYADGYTLGMIRNFLNNSGIKTKHGKAFSNSFLARVIEDDIYIGTYRFKTKGYDDIVVENILPVLVDKDLFYKANNMKQINASHINPSPRRSQRLYALTGKVRCAICGGHFTGFSATKRRNEQDKEYLYYVCKEKKVYKRCNSKFIQKEYLESVVIRTIRKLILNDEKMDEISASVADMCQSSPLEIDSEIEALCKRKSKLEKALSKLIDILADDEMESDVMASKVKTFNADLKQIKKRLYALEEQKKNLITPQSVKAYLEKMLDKSTSDNSEELKIVFDNFVDEVIVSDYDVHIKLFAFANETAETPSLHLDKTILRQ